MMPMYKNNVHPWTDLLRATSNNKFDVVDELINSKSDVNERTAVMGWTPLIMAAQKGHINIILSLLRGKACIEAQDWFGETALIKACSARQSNVIKILLDHKANVQKENSKGFTALMLAAKICMLDAVKLLIAKNANINSFTRTGFTVLMEAVTPNLYLTDINTENSFSSYLISTEERTALVTFLLASNVDVNATTTSGKMNALMYAAYGSEIQVLIKLLQAKADIDAKDADGDTALLKASMSGNHHATKILLEWKANMQVRNIFDRCSLLLASASGHKDVVLILLDFKANTKSRCNGWNALDLAARNGHGNVIQILLDIKYGMIPFPCNTTLLEYCASAGHSEVVNIFLDAKAFTCGPRELFSSLEQAVENNYPKIVDILLKANADVHCDTYTKPCLLVRAIQKGYALVINMLLITKINPNICCHQHVGSTDPFNALLLVISNGFPAAGQVLVEANVDLSTTDRFGNTPLILAVKAHYTKLVKVLIDHKADIHVKDWHHIPALVWACRRSSSRHDRFPSAKLVKTLLVAKSKINANSAGDIALCEAVDSGAEDIVKLLIEAKSNTNTRVNGDSAFCKAVKIGYNYIIKLLLEAKANPETKISDFIYKPGRGASLRKYTALVWAVIRERTHMICILLEGKANTSVTDRNGHDILSYALKMQEEEGNNHILPLFEQYMDSNTFMMLKKNVGLRKQKRKREQMHNNKSIV